MSNNPELVQKTREMVRHLLAEGGLTPEILVYNQLIALGEETGELLGAWRRWNGWARRSAEQEELEAEMADVAITLYALAGILHIDIDAAINHKLEKVFSRGWKENPPAKTVNIWPDERYEPPVGWDVVKSESVVDGSIQLTLAPEPVVVGTPWKQSMTTDIEVE